MSLNVHFTTPWWEDVSNAPPLLTELGFIGSGYRSAVTIVGPLSILSALGLIIFKDNSLLSGIGYVILGSVIAASYLALASRRFLVTLLIDNFLTPGILAVILVWAHILAWST